MDVEREFFLSLARGKNLMIKPVMVIQGEEWEISHEISDEEITTMALMPRVGKRLTLREAYAKRWLQNAYQNSAGNYYLKNSKIIRIPLIQWARNNGFYIDISDDIYLSNSNGNPRLS